MHDIAEGGENKHLKNFYTYLSITLLRCDRTVILRLGVMRTCDMIPKLKFRNDFQQL